LRADLNERGSLEESANDPRPVARDELSAREAGRYPERAVFGVTNEDHVGQGISGHLALAPDVVHEHHRVPHGALDDLGFPVSRRVLQPRDAQRVCVDKHGRLSRLRRPLAQTSHGE
jgi:hypothetical protein